MGFLIWEKTSFSAEKLDLSGLGERWIKITVVSHISKTRHHLE